MIEGFRQLFLGEDHVCPVWFAYTFDNPLRRMIHRPERLFAGLVHEGQTAIDIGCGIGHNTLGMARMVGETGRVIAVDLQKAMLAKVRQRADRAGMAARIAFHQANAQSIGLTEQVDFALAFWMVHEVPDKAAFFGELRGILKPDALFLMTEPKIHVTRETFEEEVALASDAGLKLVANPKVAVSWAALFAS
jgi:ubiquinone/menaquinone biosynthesis C-methylase UbiE